MRLPNRALGHYECKACKAVKPVESFGVDKHTSRGRKYTCKTCLNASRRGIQDPAARSRYLKRKYGITLADYEAILIKQGGVCAVCQEPGEPRNGGARARASTPLYVDHSHVDGLVRGLLCHKCNVAIGLLKDDPSRIDRASRYVRGMPVQYLGTLKCA